MKVSVQGTKRSFLVEVSASDDPDAFCQVVATLFDLPDPEQLLFKDMSAKGCPIKSPGSILEAANKRAQEPASVTEGQGQDGTNDPTVLKVTVISKGRVTSGDDAKVRVRGMHVLSRVTRPRRFKFDGVGPAKLITVETDTLC
jgi:hypothetical protein